VGLLHVIHYLLPREDCFDIIRQRKLEIHDFITVVTAMTEESKDNNMEELSHKSRMMGSIVWRQSFGWCSLTFYSSMQNDFYP